jgi:hypothetical protein
MDERTQVAVDQAGRLWVMRQDEAEIEMWEGGEWFLYGADQGWIAGARGIDSWWTPEKWSVKVDEWSRTWLPTQTDVRVFDGGRWTVYTTDEMGFSEPQWEDLDRYYAIALLGEGEQVWVGECHYSPLGPMGGGGLRRFDGGAWSRAGNPLGEECVSILNVDRNGYLWVGVEDAIWRYQPSGDTWSAYPLPEASQFGFNFNHPRDLLVDGDGDAWVIVQFCGGANCDGGSYLYHFHASGGSVAAESLDWWEPQKALFSGADGRSWLLWEGVFYQIAGGELLPMAAFGPRGMTLDAAGRVWALVGRKEEAGLWVLDPESVE